MKVVFTADIHMSNNLPFSAPFTGNRPGNLKGYTDRLLEQRDVWDQIFGFVEKKKAEALFVLGDLFDHSKVDAATLTETVRNVVKCPVPVYILPGNHDATTTTGGRFTVEAFRAMGNQRIKVIGDSLKPMKFDKVRIYSVSFRTHAETENAIIRIKKKLNPKKLNVLLLHCSILGAEAYGWKCDDGVDSALFESDFDHVLSGHFHRTQAFSKNGFYVGSPMQHSFSDEGSPSGIWVGDFRGKKRGFMFKHFETTAARFHTFKNARWKCEEFSKVKKGDFVRFEIKATHADWVKKKVAIDALCRKLAEEENLRVDYKFRPISQASQRIALPKGGGAISLKKAVAEYVKATETELDSKTLRRLGKDILASVGEQWGGVK